MYYSTSNNLWFFCSLSAPLRAALSPADTLFWIPILPLSPGFIGSGIVSPAQDLAMVEYLDYGRWVQCYNLNTMTQNSATFHAACDNKACLAQRVAHHTPRRARPSSSPCPTSARRSLAATQVRRRAAHTHITRHADRYWASRNNFEHSNLAFIFRYAGNQVQATSRVNPQARCSCMCRACDAAQYAMYDYAGYGPSWGNSDFWINTNMRTGICSPSSYTAGTSYSSSWLSVARVRAGPPHAAQSGHRRAGRSLRWRRGTKSSAALCLLLHRFTSAEVHFPPAMAAQRARVITAMSSVMNACSCPAHGGGAHVAACTPGARTAATGPQPQLKEYAFEMVGRELTR